MRGGIAGAPPPGCIAIPVMRRRIMRARFRGWLVSTARKAVSLVLRAEPKEQSPVIIAPAGSEPMLADAARFYLGAREPRLVTALSMGDYLSGAAIGYLGRPRTALKLHPAGYHLDRDHNPNDGFEWINFAAACHGHRADIEAARRRFESLMSNLRKRDAKRAYVFGTGPSLAAAMERDWSDGYRIVCNTIVRDPALWAHLEPDVVVAGDTIYHFGFTEFAKAFREDLRRRLRERPVHFIYPAMFDVIVQREFAEFRDFLIPIPMMPGKQIFRGDMDSDFSLPAVGNVINLLQLPLATTLSKEVCLWGFDGRAPNDRGFWANSGRHSYPELMHTLHEAHPAFFREHIPSGRESKYVAAVHGDLLDSNLVLLESAGWKFRMLHHSYTPTFAKRYAP
jgi:hypothetical protein